MKKMNILLASIILVFLVSFLAGCLTARGQKTPDGEGCPLVGGIVITSPSNTTYRCSLPILKFTVSSLFDSSIYNYLFIYCIDGKDNITIPSTSYSFDYPNGQTGPFCIVTLTASAGLPQLAVGSHALTVYATYERINTGNGNWPALIYDSKMVYFAINDDVPPVITNLSITNGNYSLNNLTLSFTTDKPTSWVGYNLDGAENQTIDGNTTLTGLTNGSHTLTIYFNDTLGNMATSGGINFNVDIPPPTEHSTASLMTMEVGTSASAVVEAILLVVIFRKHRQT
jgi:hypothetical protein